MKKIAKLLASALVFGAACLMPSCCEAAKQKLNYYYEGNCLLDIKDKIGDDKGNGYYQYPLDKRLIRGTFDIKNFRVYEEGDVIVFEIQMRNYIMRTWSDSGKSENQGFVANLWDIYVDIDGLENSGCDEALPGRDVLFADKMGWEKVIMICPMEPAAIEEILRDSTDNIEFQNHINDIIIPDYVEIQGDRVITKISKLKLPRISEKSGFQCFSMGYKNVVSSNRLLNRDVKAFPTHDDFGGGSNSYGEPTIIDMIVPNGANQYKILRNYTAAPYRDNIRYAEVPFVYAGGNRLSPWVEAIRKNSNPNQSYGNQSQVQRVPISLPVNQQVKPEVEAKKTSPAPRGFVPLKQNKPDTPVPTGFVPIKKK